MKLEVELSFSPHVLRLFERINYQLEQLLQGNAIMANNLDVLIQSINENTNTVATRIDNLVAALQASGQAPTPEQLTSLQQISDHLRALGADPQNPVPNVPIAVTQRAPVMAPPGATPVPAQPTSSDTPTAETAPLSRYTKPIKPDAA